MMMFAQPFAVNGDKIIIPASPTTAGRANLNTGFPPETQRPIEAGGVPPHRLDFNGLLFQITSFLWWLQSGGQWEWRSDLDYAAPAFVIRNADVYRVLVPSGPGTEEGPQDPAASSGFFEKQFSVADIQGMVNALQSEVNAANSRIDTVQASVDNLGDQVGDMEGEIGDITGEFMPKATNDSGPGKFVSLQFGAGSPSSGAAKLPPGGTWVVWFDQTWLFDTTGPGGITNASAIGVYVGGTEVGYNDNTSMAWGWGWRIQ
jgi:hypothetical protein